MEMQDFICEIQPRYIKREGFKLEGINGNRSDGFADIIRGLYDENISLYETFGALFLNNAFSILGFSTNSSYGAGQVQVDVKHYVRNALMCNATHLILFHNHPAGSLKPSNQDIEITKKIAGALNLIDIKLLDNIIITPENGYYSFTDNGLI